MSSAMCCPQTFCTEEVGGGGFFYFFYFKGGEFISFPSLIRQRWTQRASCFTCMVFTEENKVGKSCQSMVAQRGLSRKACLRTSKTSQFPTVPWEGLVNLGSWCSCLLPINYHLQAAVLKNF